MAKRKRAKPRPPPPTHCHWCKQPMGIDASHIDWEEVWLQQAIEYKELKLGRPVTEAERAEVAAATGSDPCDDCCCGACGSRKERPGEVCC